MLYVGVHGMLKDIEIADVTRFGNGFVEYLRTQRQDVLNDIATKKKLDDESEQLITSALEEYKKIFV